MYLFKQGYVPTASLGKERRLYIQAVHFVLQRKALTCNGFQIVTKALTIKINLQTKWLAYK